MAKTEASEASSGVQVENRQNTSGEEIRLTGEMKAKFNLGGGSCDNLEMIGFFCSV